MKVKVIDKRTGKALNIPRRLAKILVKRGRATYVDQPVTFDNVAEKPKKVIEKKPKAVAKEKKSPGRPVKQTYKTKDMVAKVK